MACDAGRNEGEKGIGGQRQARRKKEKRNRRTAPSEEEEGEKLERNGGRRCAKWKYGRVEADLKGAGLISVLS